jgi:hypothetical protein
MPRTWSSRLRSRPAASRRTCRRSRSKLPSVEGKRWARTRRRGSRFRCTPPGPGWRRCLQAHSKRRPAVHMGSACRRGLRSTSRCSSLASSPYRCPRGYSMRPLALVPASSAYPLPHTLRRLSPPSPPGPPLYASSGLLRSVSRSGTGQTVPRFLHPEYPQPLIDRQPVANRPLRIPRIRHLHERPSPTPSMVVDHRAGQTSAVPRTAQRSTLTIRCGVRHPPQT